MIVDSSVVDAVDEDEDVLPSKTPVGEEASNTLLTVVDSTDSEDVVS